MNPFVNRITHQQQWVLPISAVCLILGFMISLASVTNETRSTRTQYLTPDQKQRINEAAVDPDAFASLSLEVNRLQKQNSKYQEAVASRNGEGKLLNDSLQEAKNFAGLSEVEGPGVVITLSDSSKAGTNINGQTFVPPDVVIHDTDVLRVVNELYASGAEAVAVNNHRVAGTTSYRCVGSTILVNDVKIAPPVLIRAIGDPQTLYGAMNMPGGVLAEIRLADPSMVQIDKVKEQDLPAYVGSTARKYAKPVGEKK